MNTKAIRSLCGVASLLLAATGIPFLANADSPPAPTTVHVLTLDPYGAEESSDPATFLILRTGPSHAPLTVNYVLGGTADNGVDYEELSGSVTLPETAWLARVQVKPVDDFEVEGNESVVLALQQPPIWPPPYAVSWPAVAAARIADNDREPVNQPPAVSLTRPPSGAVFEAHDDILLVARASDRDGWVKSVEFFAGETSLGVVPNRPLIAPTDLDVLAGSHPTFELDADLLPDLNVDPADLTAAQLPGTVFRLKWEDIPPGTHVLTAVATDNDGASTTSDPVEIIVVEVPPQPVVNVIASDPVASEADPATDFIDMATFKIHRRGPTDIALPVFYRLSGKAENGVDYAKLPLVAEIPPGERSVDVVIEPLHDLLVEGPEGVVLTIVPPVCLAIFPPPPECYRVGRTDTARAVIRDDDVAPNQSPLVRLVHPRDGDMFVSPASIRLAALASDPDGRVKSVEFFEGDNSLGVVTNDPNSVDADRPPFMLVWEGVPPGYYVLTAVATDNGGASTRSRPVEIKVLPSVGPPVVNITATDPVCAETTSDERPNLATFNVHRSGSVDRALQVFYRIDGTADNGQDYDRLTGRATIERGDRTAKIVIIPVDDRLVEGAENIVLRLVSSPILSSGDVAPVDYYRIGLQDVARAILFDNDRPPVNLPPRVAIVNPQDGGSFEVPADIKLSAAAHDPDGWVRQVEFFDGNHSLGVVMSGLGPMPTDVDGTGPDDTRPEQLFRLPWHSVPPGEHLLTAVATDNRGVSTRSNPVRIMVFPPPWPAMVIIQATDPYASEGPLVVPYPMPESDGVEGPSDGPIRPIEPNTATFMVTRSGDLSHALAVYYSLRGSAKNGQDYSKLSGELLIPQGKRSARIVVRPIDDRLVEGKETVVVELLPVPCLPIEPPPPGCYVVGKPERATAFILDNDFNQSPRLEIVEPAEGDLFRPGSDIDINVVVRDPDGWVSTMEFFANGDLIDEQTIYFFVEPESGQVQKFSTIWNDVPTGAYTLTARATDNRGAKSVSDPVHIKVGSTPAVPVITIHAVDPVGTEPNPLLPLLPDPAAFEVRRDGETTHDLRVDYRIGGVSENGQDYRKLPGHIVIPAGAASARIQVAPLHDTLVEGAESVILSLNQPDCANSDAHNGQCYRVGRPSRSVAYIRDNDTGPNRPPRIAMVSPANGAVLTAPVDLRLVAQAWDPDGWVRSVEFFDGEVSLGVVSSRTWILEESPERVPGIEAGVLSDHSPEQPFVLPWKDVPPGKHILTAVATDNAGDSSRSQPIELKVLEPGSVPIVNITAPDPIAREGTANTATFRIRRAGPADGPLTVWYSIHGSAVNGVDYKKIPNQVTIPADRRTARVTIDPLEDQRSEWVETVVLRMIEPPSGATAYAIGRPSRAGAIILDNDRRVPETVTLKDGRMHLRLGAPEGMPFRLEASDNLRDWETVCSDIVREDGISYVDEQGEHTQRFFRVVQEFGDFQAEE